MRVVVAPDSFKGTLTAREAADAIVEGWRTARPEDELVAVPMSDGGDGLLVAVGREGDRELEVEVADALGHPRPARFLLREGGLAIVESAEACGLVHVPVGQRNPLHTTTYGVGQLLDAAREAGARRILVGLGGSATVDGGAGALLGLGFAVTVGDGSGVKIGGGRLGEIAAVTPRWTADWSDVEIRLLADVETTLFDAPRRFGPQKGATPDDVEVLERGLANWSAVVASDLPGAPAPDTPGTGAAGGLGFGLAAGLGGRFVPGARAVAELVGLPDHVADADLLVVGEGELDDTSGEGKVVGALLDLAAESGVPVAAVVGRTRRGDDGFLAVEESHDTGPDARAAVVAAAGRLGRSAAPD